MELKDNSESFQKCKRDGGTPPTHILATALTVNGLNRSIKNVTSLLTKARVQPERLET